MVYRRHLTKEQQENLDADLRECWRRRLGIVLILVVVVLIMISIIIF